MRHVQYKPDVPSDFRSYAMLASCICVPTPLPSLHCLPLSPRPYPSMLLQHL